MTPLMCKGAGSPLCFLKLIIMSFVLEMLSTNLFVISKSANFISSLYADLSLSCIRPTTVVSSANLIMAFVLLAGTQSCVKGNRRGCSTHPCGAPVLIDREGEW